MKKGIEIDRLDKKILSILMRDAKIAYTEIAKKLFVSGGTIHVRMKKLEDVGIVKGHSLTVDHGKLGYDISAYLGIYLDKSSLYEDVAKELEKIPEVVEAHYTTGFYNIFARVFFQRHYPPQGGIARQNPEHSRYPTNRDLHLPSGKYQSTTGDFE